MGGDTKTEPGVSPKVGYRGVLSDEVKAEVASLVQAALAQMQQPGYDCSITKTALPVVEIPTADTETERRHKEIVSALEARLSETNKQLESAYHDLGDARDQLEKQRAKSVQLEQRILQLSQVETTFKSTMNVLRAEKERALAREREALLNRDRFAAHNVQLSNQMSELQSELDLRAAQLNDAAYQRQQLENRINELNKENMSLRQSVTPQGASTGASTGAPTQSGATTGPATSPQSAQPPSNLYFAVPVNGARRHTVPNVYPSATQTSPRVPSGLPLNRPPKRSRADSDVSACSDSTQSGSSMTFALRPVKFDPAGSNPSTSASIAPSNNTGYPQHQAQAHSPVSPTAPVSPYYPQQQQGTYATPISYHNQASHQTQVMIPQGPTSTPPTVGAAQSVTRPPMPSMASAPAQMVQPAPVQRVPTVQQFIDQMFSSTLAGFPECKICKVHPLGRPAANGASTPPTIPDLLAHAERFHGRTIRPKPTQQQQT
ncbi:unnamed protein product [Rhizoctonia solani]|uniref:Uncharacterized protein n=1 Tax=Rhizoctonia solani TaxID=456999 RepID=A0A8H3BSW8_9AGAM|nr:unnamed protein product [Rhizoctonia solani]